MERTKKDNRLPIFTERFRELQGDLSNTDYADFLGISRQTVGFYCNGDRLPDVVTLLKIAEKCNVSTDYLLGKSDVKTTDPEIQAICNYTGLSSGTVFSLHIFRSENSVASAFLSRLFDDLVYRGFTLVESITSNIVRAAHAAAVYRKDNKLPSGRLKANADLHNIIASMNGDDNGMFQISALDAATYYLERAKDDTKRNIDLIIETMVDELEGKDSSSELMHDESDTILWPLGDEDDF